LWARERETAARALCCASTRRKWVYGDKIVMTRKARRLRSIDACCLEIYRCSQVLAVNERNTRGWIMGVVVTGLGLVRLRWVGPAGPRILDSPPVPVRRTIRLSRRGWSRQYACDYSVIWHRRPFTGDYMEPKGQARLYLYLFGMARRRRSSSGWCPPTWSWNDGVLNRVFWLGADLCENAV